MLKMRLQRTGRKHDPSFRIIVQEHTRGPRAGRHVDLLGNYDVKKGGVKFDKEKVQLWLSRGVQPSGTVWNLLVSEGLVEGKKVNVLPKKTVPEKEAEESAPEKESEAPKGEAQDAEGDAVEKLENPADAEEKGDEAPAESAEPETQTEEKPKEDLKEAEPSKDEPEKEEAKEEPKEEPASPESDSGEKK